MKNKIVSILKAWDYLFYQRYLPQFGMLCAFINVFFYFMLEHVIGYQDTLLGRSLSAVAFLLFYFLPRDTELKTWQKVFMELTYNFTTVIVFSYLLLLNNVNMYWFCSMIFCGLAYGLFAYQPIGIIGYVVSSTLVTIIFSRYYYVPDDTLKMAILAHIVSFTMYLLASSSRTFFQLSYLKILELDLGKIESEQKGKMLIQKQIHMSSQLASLGILAAGTAHEINNPLTILQANIYRLTKDLSPNEKNEKRLKQMAEACSRIANIVSNLKVFDKNDPDVFEEFNFNEVVQTVASFFNSRASADKIEVSLKLDERVPDNIYASKAKLQQVFLNVIQNAFEAYDGESGGKITLSTVVSGNLFIFLCEDQGKGIDSNSLVHMFDPFYTTKDENKGMGIGLSTCYAYIKEMGGEIQIESEVKVGTTCKIIIPMNFS